ncbi:MAG: tetratricopeptide repeat protein [Candidatus Heimdallarchaeaceae archaeon]
MPSSVKEELDRILRKSMRWEIDDILDDLDNVLEDKGITKEEQIIAKIIQSEVYSLLYLFWDERGSREISMKLAQEVIEESKNLGDNYLIVASNLCLANIHFSDSKWQEFQKLMKEVLKTFGELEPRTDLFYLRLKACVLNFKGVLLYTKIYTGESLSDEEREEAFQLWIEAEKFCEKNNLYDIQITGCLNNIKFVHLIRGELDLAIEISQKMITIAKELGNKILIGRTLFDLAYVYYQKGDYKKYFEINKERLLIYEELDNKPAIAGAYWSLGAYYSIIGEYDEALDYYEQALEVVNNYKRENSTAVLQQNIGYVYFLKGEFEKALEFYEKAYPVLKENQPQGWYEILSDLAALSIQKGELDKALEYLDQLMKIQKGFQNQPGISDVLSKKGMIYWQKGMKEQALSSMQENLEIRQKLDNKDLIATSLSYLIQFNV